MLLMEVEMRKNPLMEAPPYPVEQALKKLGANLRTARVRRNLTITDVGEKIGAGPRVVADAEQGKAFTGIAVYTALLWLYDLLTPFEDLANPLKDEQGLVLESRRTRTRARKSRGLDNDF
jgi:transcriptional regulator with XRE-family HTH domain